MNIRYGFAGTALALFAILITFIMCINVQSSALHDRNLQRRRRGRRPFKRSFAQNNNNLNRMTMENVTCHFYTQPWIILAPLRILLFNRDIVFTMDLRIVVRRNVKLVIQIQPRSSSIPAMRVPSTNMLITLVSCLN